MWPLLRREEVAQETLLKVFESAEQLHEPEKVRSWVFRIPKNACLMKRRRKWTTKSWTTKSGALRAGTAFQKTTLLRLHCSTWPKQYDADGAEGTPERTPILWNIR